MLPVVIIIAIAAILIAAALYDRRLKRKRIEALTGWASQHGLEFLEYEDGSYDGRFPAFECLKQGSNRYAYNRCEGVRNGNSLCAFDYHYETYTRSKGGRRRTHHHYFSAVVVKSPIVLKPLFLRPENFFDKVKEFFGADDIDFESIEFSRRFFVKAPDKRWAYDVIHQRTMEFLLASPAFAIEFGTWDAIVWRSSTFSAPEEFEAALRVIEGIFERFPEYLRKQQLGEKSPQG